jgi:hypothetical protein
MPGKKDDKLSENDNVNLNTVQEGIIYTVNTISKI